MSWQESPSKFEAGDGRHGDLPEIQWWEKCGLDFRLSLTRPMHTRVTAFPQSHQFYYTADTEHEALDIEEFVSRRGLRGGNLVVASYPLMVLLTHCFFLVAVALRIVFVLLRDWNQCLGLLWSSMYGRDTKLQTWESNPHKRWPHYSTVAVQYLTTAPSKKWEGESSSANNWKIKPLAYHNVAFPFPLNPSAGGPCTKKNSKITRDATMGRAILAFEVYVLTYIELLSIYDVDVEL